MKRFVARAMLLVMYRFGRRAAPIRWRAPIELRGDAWEHMYPFVEGDWYETWGHITELGPNGWRERAVPLV